jgi:hypothetical protein
MRTIYNPAIARLGGNGVGPRNQTKMFNSAGSFDWVVPADIDPQVPVLARVWGAGGACGLRSSSTGNGHGGGGGGLAMSEIPVSALTIGAAVSLIVGLGAQSHDGAGGTSSFGAFLSATGGNSGFNAADNQGAAVLGVGGIGVGGDINRRGGTGGIGEVVSNSGSGGGGASAPHPDGHIDGFNGGDGFTRSGGGGASICFPGTMPEIANASVGGAGTASRGTSAMNSSANQSFGGSGGSGLLGAGGRGASSTNYSNAACAMTPAGDGGGCALFEPNTVLLGGGGGGGNAMSSQSSDRAGTNAGNGGPGAGGGSASPYSSGATYAYMLAGNGGVLGGGGGAGQYCAGGNGGNAGGGGGSGYQFGTATGHGLGGDGLIILQYALIL